MEILPQVQDVKVVTSVAEDATEHEVLQSFASVQPQLAQQQDMAAQMHFFNVQHMDLHQGIGMFKAFDFISNVGSVAKTRWLMERKDSEDYKGVHVPLPGGGTKTLKSFADLCEAVGVTKSKAYEDIQNLALFGEQFMQSAEKAGLGYRQLRNLRKLDEASRETVLEEAQSTDNPDDLRFIIEDAYEAKAKMRKDLDAVKADYEASKQVSAKTREKLDKAERELAKLKVLPEKAQASQRAELRRDVFVQLGKECEIFAGRFPMVMRIATGLMDAARAEEDYEVVSMVTEKISQLCAALAQGMDDAGIDVSFEAILEGYE